MPLLRGWREAGQHGPQGADRGQAQLAPSGGSAPPRSRAGRRRPGQREDEYLERVALALAGRVRCERFPCPSAELRTLPAARGAPAHRSERCGPHSGALRLDPAVPPPAARPDTAVLQGGATLYRRSLARRPRIVVVTGSIGKTTATQAILAALGTRQHQSTNGNTGVALACGVLGIRPWQRHGVLEISAAYPGSDPRHLRMIRRRSAW